MKKLSHLLIAISAIILSSFMFVGGCDDGDGGTTIPDIPTSIGGDMSLDMSMDMSSEEGPTMDGWDDI